MATSTVHKCRAFVGDLNCGAPATARHPLMPQLYVCEQHLEERGHVKPLPCITLYQPYASWMAWGLKTLETRNHDKLKCLLGREIGIHAGFGFDPTAFRMAKPFAGDLDLRAREFGRNFAPVPLSGVILAKGYVSGFRQLSTSDSRAALFPCHTGDRWGLELEGVEELRPYVRVKGKQGIWYWF